MEARDFSEEGEHNLLGLKLNGPEAAWKVYSRNRWGK